MSYAGSRVSIAGTCAFALCASTRRQPTRQVSNNRALIAGLTVQWSYCTVVGMSIEDSVLERIVAGETPAEIQFALEIDRERYYNALDSLTGSGILSRFGDLPYGAVTELCPPTEAIGLFAEVFQDSGWNKRITDSLRSLCVRYGWIEPSETDQRYTRSRWTGNSYRRVDFNAGGGTDQFMVVGALLPRADKQTWQRATPKFRVVYIESLSSDLQVSLVWERGRIVTSTAVDDAIWGSLTPSDELADALNNGLLADIVLAVAWVMESRALLARRVSQ